MISKQMEEALNKQMNREFFSAYLYLAMSAFFETAVLKGFANWMRVQAKEEQVHALKFYDFIVARGGKVSFLPIESPKTNWTSAGKVFEQAYAHEQKVTGMINSLVELATKGKDHAAFEMLQWFVKEQVEEEENTSEILAKIKDMGDIQGHLFFLDHELGKRK